MQLRGTDPTPCASASLSQAWLPRCLKHTRAELPWGTWPEKDQGGWDKQREYSQHHLELREIEWNYPGCGSYLSWRELHGTGCSPAVSDWKQGQKARREELGGLEDPWDEVLTTAWEEGQGYYPTLQLGKLRHRLSDSPKVTQEVSGIAGN